MASSIQKCVALHLFASQMGSYFFAFPIRLQAISSSLSWPLVIGSTSCQ